MECRRLPARTDHVILLGLFSVSIIFVLFDAIVLVAVLAKALLARAWVGALVAAGILAAVAAMGADMLGIRGHLGAGSMLAMLFAAPLGYAAVAIPRTHPGTDRREVAYLFVLVAILHALFLGGLSLALLLLR